jgi:hypothetical protein
MSTRAAHIDYVLARVWPGGPIWHDLDYAERRIVSRIAREMSPLEKLSAEDPRLHHGAKAHKSTSTQGMYGRHGCANSTRYSYSYKDSKALLHAIRPPKITKL